MINRKITQKLLAALKDSPVILIHGARQTGKSTLIKHIISEKYSAKYLTFDDTGILSAVSSNPIEFLSAYDGSIAIDEVQRVPEIFMSIKYLVDKNRKPGKFILTGSANVLFLPRVSESLAGRMEIINLYPFSQNEMSGSNYNLLDEMFKRKFKIPPAKEIKNNIIEKVISGGYPEIQTRTRKDRRDAWFKSYISAILQRDIRDISNIEKLNEFPQLLNIIASRAGTLLNFAELSRSAAIPQTTLKRYIALLESIFMVQTLPTWSSNLSKRLIKAPKFYIADTGLLAHLTGFTSERINIDPNMWGRIFENFILNELTKQISWSKNILNIYHFRTSSGQEVDFVIERNDGALVGIEVKASSKVDNTMFNHLRVLASETGKRFLRGFVIYTGSEVIPFGKNLFALPVSLLCDE